MTLAEQLQCFDEQRLHWLIAQSTGVPIERVARYVIAMISDAALGGFVPLYEVK